MANKTLSENITQTINDFDSIRQAIISKRVEVPDGTKTSEYAEKIKEIGVGEGPDTGAESSTLLDISQVTNFSYFCHKNRFVNKLSDLDTSKGTDFSYVFYECTNLFSIPMFDTSSGINFNHTFYGCTDISSIPAFDTSSGTNFDYTFSNCSKLTEIPQIDVSNGTNFYGMFAGCTNLTMIPQLDTSKGSNFTSMFSNCTNLRTVKLTSVRGSLNGMFYNCSELMTLEFSKIDISNNNFNLSNSPNLTVGSLLNVLNALSDNTGKIKYTVTLGETNLSKLTDEQKQIATDKNYRLL